MAAAPASHAIWSTVTLPAAVPHLRLEYGEIFPLNTQQHIDVIASAEAIMWQPAFISGFVGKITWKKLFADLIHLSKPQLEFTVLFMLYL